MKTSSASQIKNAVFSKICSSLKLTAVLSGLVLPFATSAAQTTWTGAVDNNWHEAGNWNNGTPTAASSNATFNMTGSTSVSLVGASGNTARLVMENGTVNLDLSSNTLTGTNLIFLTGNGDTLSVKDGTMTGFTGLTAGVSTTDDDNTMNLNNVTLNVGSGSITIGRQGSGNSFNVTNGATVSTTGSTSMGTLASSGTNSITIQNATFNTGVLHIGAIDQANDNTVTAASGADLNVSGNLFIGRSAASGHTTSGNTMVVQSGADVDHTGSVFQIGLNGTNSSLQVQGGNFTSTAGSAQILAGTDNRIEVSGGTAEFTGTLTSRGLIRTTGGTLNVSDLVATTSNSSFDLQGGTLILGQSDFNQPSTLVVGNGTGATATLQLDGGTHDTG
ncbi:MAG: hypothetical protein ACK5NG_01895, partial [Chthoniobacterales bacterium]